MLKNVKKVHIQYISWKNNADVNKLNFFKTLVLKYEVYRHIETC